MKNLITLVTLTLLILNLSLQTSIAQCHFNDWVALRALYNRTDGDNWFDRAGWDAIIANQNSPPNNCNLDDLTGINLDNEGRVNYINLSSNGLNGDIPFFNVHNLPNLTTLQLSDNQLSGSILAELSNLTNLTLLEISNNQLSGCYPNDLTTFCTQLNHPQFDGNIDISDGNNFDATWSEFCATGAGDCSLNITVWPGDVNLDGICDNKDYTIFHLNMNYIGNSIPRPQQGIQWQPYSIQDWGFSQNFINCYDSDVKHFDCNGDGSINITDKNAILLNWGSTHNESPSYWGWCSPCYTGIPLSLPDNIFLQPIGNVINNTLIMNIVLDNIDGDNFNIYGGYFTIFYHNSIISKPVVIFIYSWLGLPNIDLAVEDRNIWNQKIEIGFSRTDGTNVIGSGIIGQMAFQIDNFDIDLSRPSIIDINLYDGGFNDKDGNFSCFRGRSLSINIGAINCESSINIDEGTPFQNLYQSSSTITTNGYLPIGESQQVQYNANRVTLNEGFRVKAGADFKVRSSGCN